MNISSIETTTQHEYTTERDACIIEMLDEIQGMVHNFSYKYRMDYDDCYQHACLLMLQVWPKIPDGYNVKAYLNAVIRRGLCQLLKEHIDYSNDILSLDMACTEDGGTLLDTLQAPEQSCAEGERARVEKVEEVVHAALRECRTEEQEYAVKRYELTAYTPVQNEKVAYRGLVKKKRRAEHMKTSIKKVFYRHPQVLALVQRETAVL
jgi:DNA-directed RNA polymerase specialized sigma24 family protein